MSSNHFRELFHHTGFVVTSTAAIIERSCRAAAGRIWPETWPGPQQRVRAGVIYPSQLGDPINHGGSIKVRVTIIAHFGEFQGAKGERNSLALSAAVQFRAGWS